MGFKKRQNARDGARSTHPFPDNMTLGEFRASGKADEWLRDSPAYQDCQRKAQVVAQEIEQISKPIEKMVEKMGEPARQIAQISKPLEKMGEPARQIAQISKPLEEMVERLQEILDRPENEIWWHVNMTDPQLWRMLRSLRSYLEKSRVMKSEEALTHIVVMTQDDRALRDGVSDRDVAIMDMVDKHGRALVCKVLNLTRKQLRNIALRDRKNRSPPPVPDEKGPRLK